MRSLVFAVVALAFMAGTASAQNVSADPKQAPTGRYAADTHHTLVLFSILHEGMANYWGRFDKVSGTLNFVGSQPEKSAVTIDIDITSLNVPSQALNTELVGPTVFDTGRFPTATFVSTSVQRTGPTTGRITGNLTLKGVTKPVTLDVVFHGGAQNPMSDSYAIGFSATATIKRSDFGITGMRWEPLVSDDVNLTIEALFQQQKD